MSTEYTAAELIEAFQLEGIDAKVEETGGGTATLIIDGGAVMVGPGYFGDNGAVFDTAELSYGFYDADGEEVADAVWFEEDATSADIARAVGIAYSQHKGVEVSEGDAVVIVAPTGFHKANTWEGAEWKVTHVRPARGRVTLEQTNGKHANPLELTSVPISAIAPLTK
ncbi:hypothetical protein HYQ19_gp037 [Arthrobacter phage DrYang]|uniref:Uncharacterized protein n=1 Tax=Arthrobacter phage DrYang TaxID=2686080 RepID=A0A6B9JD29_9CAUD|nr:hypothetical protein HYQ19_gp037 [Arthrobacter phage DrYang]QGZ17136.1 hypothetical protein SEA_DRYANG_37 [Arthrobacter phage DrYang]